MVFLHGVLNLEIIEGKDLPDVDSSWFRSAKDVSDPYVTVDTCSGGKRSCRIAKTSIIFDSLNPHWGEKFRIEMCQETESFLVTVKDVDLINIDCMGYMTLRADELAAGEPIAGWFPLIDRSGNPAGSLNILMHFHSFDSIVHSNDVPEVSFPMREGCLVSLYQDAHTPALPPLTDVPCPTGGSYEPPQLWMDIAKMLRQAEKFIYIIGWSVKPDISLARDEDSETIGELLKRKAESGIRVLIMVWNEALSNDMMKGLMNTHDEETRVYFEGTEVEVFLAPRSKAKGKLLETSFVATCYTHHQKCIITDAEIEGDSRRRILSFVGGIDLTDGRWDTPEHPLFKTLPDKHQHDFYNGCCPSNVSVGPRQPWHDIHALVEGRAAVDVLDNFVERWRCQAPDRENRLLTINDKDFMIDWKAAEDKSFNVQFFRSINSDSASFGNDILDRLLARKGRLYDNSIQRAYIHHIRRAKHFVFIENQYFLGSSHGWLIQDAKCPHLIPIELTMKIVNAIRNRENFRVYVIIPMHPEGDPMSSAVQEILYWQRRTMEMMYHKIAKALHKNKVDAVPSDYLSFFCLGKRESPEELPDSLSSPEVNSVAAKARENMRFMIYVHSKMAIFDDEYILVGSANINERSMSGNRDSEMAVGAYQPKFTKEECDGEINGAIRSFRLSLWAEHCGIHTDEHMDPSSASCMAYMRRLAEDNLQKYLAKEPIHNDSHLLLYPVTITEEGHVKAREGCETFPDTGASILGKSSHFLPNSLTT